jgi:hypothetical protein
MRVRTLSTALFAMIILIPTVGLQAGDAVENGPARPPRLLQHSQRMLQQSTVNARNCAAGDDAACRVVGADPRDPCRPYLGTESFQICQRTLCGETDQDACRRSADDARRPAENHAAR